MGPWMEGCVPDSMRYVPGRRFVAVQVSAVVAPAGTSVENDCTRGPCAGGVPFVDGSATGHVVSWALEWSGLGVGGLCARFPRPPPNCPTITSEVGTVLPFNNERLFVRLMVRPCPVGTLITTGDQPVANGFNAAQVAVEPVTAAPQVRSEEHTSELQSRFDLVCR